MNVSRETQGKLDIYLDLLGKWNSKINLVSKGTLGEAKLRHFQDSLQLLDLVNSEASTWADFGSGGGFPGAVVAITAQAAMPKLTVTLVESDQRKATFLRTVSRETQVPITIVAKRVEEIDPLNSDVISARALAPLTKLLEFTERHMSPAGRALFLKGENWKQELSDAQKHWNFQWDAHKSRTNADAVILEIGELTRA